MSRAGEERYVFETEWFDIQASLIRKYLFTFYPADNTIEMVRFKSYMKDTMMSHYAKENMLKTLIYIKNAKI